MMGLKEERSSQVDEWEERWRRLHKKGMFICSVVCGKCLEVLKVEQFSNHARRFYRNGDEERV